jgi:hypothetical protein
MDSRGGKITVALIVVCVLVGGGYVAYAALGPGETSTDASPSAAASSSDVAVMVRAVDPANPALNGGVFVVEDGKVRRRSEDLACERVYYAAGHGICMGVAASGVDYTASVFDDELRPQHSIRLTGLPSRARVSADGRYGAMTVFVSGDAYLSTPTAFSTRTYLLDMKSGETIGQLEQFDVSKDGARFDSVDFNFWGITFDPGDSDRFYATLGTGDHHYLVEGSVGGREVRVLRDGVECPSLSPDGKRIAFKSRIEGTNRWRLHVLDLATLGDHPVAEERSIDDQAEWLDADTLVYSNGINVYAVAADGDGEPALLIRDATSPVAMGN